MFTTRTPGAFTRLYLRGFCDILSGRGGDSGEGSEAGADHVGDRYPCSETAAAVRGLSLAKAVKFLEDVQTHTQCVPFRRHNGAVGRTAQAKIHGVVQGRWPVK